MNKRKRQQTWQTGDCFTIPLKDGSFLVGQVLAAEPSVLNSVSCALYDQRSNGETLLRPNPSSVFSTLLTTRDLLDSGDWKVLATFPVELPSEKFPFESLRGKGFVGAKVIGSGIVNEFANAFCGLVPWDDWADPTYLDRLLLDPKSKPTNLRYKA